MAFVMMFVLYSYSPLQLVIWAIIGVTSLF